MQGVHAVRDALNVVAHECQDVCVEVTCVESSRLVKDSCDERTSDFDDSTPMKPRKYRSRESQAQVDEQACKNQAKAFLVLRG